MSNQQYGNQYSGQQQYAGQQYGGNQYGGNQYGYPPPPPQQAAPPYYSQQGVSSSGAYQQPPPPQPPQPPQPYKQSSDALHGVGAGPTGNAGGRFDYAGRPRFPDLWATVLFLANLCGFAAFSGYGFVYGLPTLKGQQPAPTSPGNRPSQQPPPFRFPPGSEQTLYTVLFSTIAATFVFCLLYFLAMQRFGKFMIKATIVMSVGIWFAYAILLFSMGPNGYFFGVIVLILALLNALFFWMARHRIPMAAFVMETVCGITRKYPMLMLVTVLSLVFQTAFSTWWSVSYFGIGLRYQQDSTALAFASVYFVFTLYWVTQVLKNSLHVTICGVFGTHYFLQGTAAMPRNPTLSSAKRAFTSSFGPICFGSLVIALIQTFRYIMMELGRQHEIAAAIVDCILGCIQGIIEYFNSFAYVQVAVYGKSYVQAAKDTWRVLGDSGVSVIVNDLLVGTVLGFGIFVVGLFAAGMSYLWAESAFEARYQEMLPYIVAVTVVCFLVGVVMMTIVVQVVDSGVQTTLVCLAEDPGALARTKPQLYEKFKATYPQQVHWL